MRRKKLAIISSYNELCGNATYTYVLQKELSKFYDVTVFPLNQFFLRSTSKKIKNLGDEHIKEIAYKLKNFDYVNIQFEAGLFGVYKKDIVRRFETLVEASQNLIVTLHRLDLKKDLYLTTFIKSLLSNKNPVKTLKEFKNKNYFASMYEDIINIIKNYSYKKPVKIVVHTKREKRNIKAFFSFDRVYDHPITFLTKNEIKFFKDRAIKVKGKFLKKYNLNENHKLIGIFGFLSHYKGHITAIKALENLPSNYKLFICGSQHPQSINMFEDINPYVKELTEYIEEKDKENIKQSKFLLKERLLSIGQLEENLLKNRVVFVGALNDEDFITYLNLMDYVVLPYLETGQSGSGIAALTLETESNAIFSNNYAFMELKKYTGDAFEMFDIGNYLELANKIKYFEDGKYKEAIQEYYNNYNINTNIYLYKRLFEENI